MAEETVVCIVLAAVVGLIPIFLIGWSKSRAKKCDCVTTAVLEGYERFDYPGQEVDFAPVYRYTVDGKEYRTMSGTKVNNTRRWAVGKEVTLRYQSNDPNKIYVGAEKGVLKMICGFFWVMAIFLFCLGIL